MKQEYSIQRAVSDGTLSTLTIGVRYLSRNDMYLRIAGVEIPQFQAVNTDYTWEFIDDRVLRITPVVPVDTEVVLYRRTYTGDLINIFSQGAQFDESTIDENNTQLLYIAQEYLEQGAAAVGVDTIEFVRDDGTFMYFRVKRTDGTYSAEFTMPSMSGGGSDNDTVSREALRRSYLNAGYNLVPGSLQQGAMLFDWKDVVLDETSGKGYSWYGNFPHEVLPNTPIDDFLDVSSATEDPKYFVEEAPYDGQMYGRMSGGWSPVPTTGGGSDSIDSALPFAKEDNDGLNKFSVRQIDFNPDPRPQTYNRYVGGHVGSDGNLYFIGYGNGEGVGILQYCPASALMRWHANDITTADVACSCLISKSRVVLVSEAHSSSTLVTVQYLPRNIPMNYASSGRRTLHISAYDPAYSVTSVLFCAAVPHPNGKVYLMPRDSHSVVEIDPDVDEDPVYHPIDISTEDGTTDRWWGAALGPDGKIYCAPYNSNSVLEFDPETNTMQKYLVSNNPNERWRGAIVGLDGKIYFPPAQHGQCLQFDVYTKSSWPENATWMEDDQYGGVLAPNGKLYFAPHQKEYTRVSEYTPNSSRFLTVMLYANGDFPPPHPPTTPWNAPSCRGGVLALNGKVYFPNQNGLLEVTPSGWCEYAHKDFHDLVSRYTSLY